LGGNGRGFAGSLCVGAAGVGARSGGERGVAGASDAGAWVCGGDKTVAD
jgi:hypothetical protein